MNTDLQVVRDAAAPVEDRLCALGRLLYAGSPELEPQLVTELGGRLAEVRGATLEEALERSISALLLLLEEMTPCSEDAEVEQAMLRCFSARDRVEELVTAAQWLSRGHYVLPVEADRACRLFEQAVADELWRLTAFNEVRSKRARLLPEGVAERAWWWSRGRRISEGAAPNLAGVVELIAEFPEAREMLELALEGQRLVEGFAPAQLGSAAGPRVVSLREWLASRGRGQAAPGLRLAAQGEPQVVADTPELQVSYRDEDHTLIVDVVAERRAEEPPWLEVRGQNVAMQPVPGLVDSFELVVPVDWEAGTLSCQLDGEHIVKLTLPLE